MFCVGVFTKENAGGIVCRDWLHEDEGATFTHWPPKSAPADCIRNNAPVEQSWRRYEFRVKDYYGKSHIAHNHQVNIVFSKSYFVGLDFV
jgi:hypothetical protein